MLILILILIDIQYSQEAVLALIPFLLKIDMFLISQGIRNSNNLVLQGTPLKFSVRVFLMNEIEGIVVDKPYPSSQLLPSM